MVDTESINPNVNKYLEKIESRLNRKGRLAHEAGAGAPCLKCAAKCPGFELHYWRKRCLNCRCSKDDHDIQDDDEDYGSIVIGKLFDQPEKEGTNENEVRGNAFKAPTESKNKTPKVTSLVLPSDGGSQDYDWVPPNVEPQLAARYMNALPENKRPVVGSEAAKSRKHQLEHQVPLYDLDENQCSVQMPSEELQEFKAHLEHLRAKVVGQGIVTEIQLAPKLLVGEASPVPSLAKPLKKPPVGILKRTSAYGGDPSNPLVQSTGDNLGNNNDSDYWPAPPPPIAGDGSTPEYRDAQMVTEGVAALGLQDSNSNPLLEQLNNTSNLRSPSKNALPKPYSSPWKQSAYPSTEGDDMKQNSERSDAPSAFSGLLKKFQHVSAPLDNHGHAIGTTLPSPNHGYTLGSTLPNHAQTLGSTLPNHAQTLGTTQPNHAQTLGTTLPNHAQTMGTTLPNHGQTLGTTLPNHAQTMGTTLPNHGQTLGTTLPNHAQTMGTTLPNHGQTLGTTLPNHAQTMGTTLPNHGQTLGTTLPNHAQTMGTTLPNHGQTLGTTLPNHAQTMGTTLPNHGQTLGTTLPNHGQTLGTTLPNHGQTLGTTLPNHAQTQMAPSAAYEAEQFPVTPHRERLAGGLTLPQSSTSVSVQLPHEAQILSSAPLHHQEDDAAPHHHQCEQCKQPMVPGEVTVICERAGPKKFWHPGCFVCSECDELLADMIYFWRDDKVYCGRHYCTAASVPRCKACDELIFSDSWTRAEDNDWHLAHFCCFLCDKELAGFPYIAAEGEQPYCMDCHMAVQAKPCMRCDNKISPSARQCQLKGFHFHADDKCFSCYHCNKPLLGGKMKMVRHFLFCSQACVNEEAEQIEE